MQTSRSTPLSADEIRRIAGPLNDAAIARIDESGATAAELIEAQQWLEADDALATDEMRPLTGRVRMLYELLEAENELAEELQTGGGSAAFPATR